MAKIGEILQAKGRLTAAQLEEALKKQAGNKARLGTILVEMGAVDVDQVAEALSEQRGFPPATRKDFEAATAITLVCIPAPFAQQFKAFPLRREAGKLVVAFATPYERSQVEPVRSMAGMELVPCIAPEILLLYYQEMRYRLKRPERFAHWSPTPTTQSPAAAGASHPPAASDPRHATVRFGSTSQAPLSTSASPAPEPRQGTALFGVGAPAPLSSPPSPAPPKFSIPPPAAAAPASPTAPSSPPARFSLLDPNPGFLATPATTPIPAPPTPALAAAKPVASASAQPSIPPPPAPGAPFPAKPVPTPAPMPAVPAVPQVAKPAATVSPLPGIPPSPAPAKSAPTPVPTTATSAPPADAAPVPPAAAAPAAAEMLPGPALKADESSTVRVTPAVPPEAKRSEPELAGETVRVAQPTSPAQAKLPLGSLDSGPEPFSTPNSSTRLEGPTTPISPELLAIAQQPDAPPSSFFAPAAQTAKDDEVPIIQGDPLVEDPTPITDVSSGSPEVSGWGDAMPEALPAKALVVAPPVAGPPQPAAPAPVEAKTAVSPATPAAPTPEPAAPVPAPRRTTKEELPAAILASEMESGQQVEKSRRETDRDVTLPRIVAARDLFDSSVGKPLEGGPVKSLNATNLYGRPDDLPKLVDMPKTEETTLPAGEKAGPPVEPAAPAIPVAAPLNKEPSLAELASELSEPIKPEPRAEEKLKDVAATPAESAKTLPPPPRKTVKEGGSRPPVERPVMSAAASPPAGGSKLFMGIGIGAAVALVLGGVGAKLSWPKPALPCPAPVVCKECPPLPPPPPEAQKATLEGSDGLVERLGLDGEWAPAAANAVVADGEQVRTGQGARAKLRVGAGLVVIGEYSRVAQRRATTAAPPVPRNARVASVQFGAAAPPGRPGLAARATRGVGGGWVFCGASARGARRRATTAAHRFRLNAGFASFQYGSAALPFEIELAGGKVLAAGKADVTAFADDLRAALSPRAGSLTISAASGAGKKVELAVGRQATVAADGTIGDAVDLPPKLELELEPPRKGDKVWILEGTVVGGPARVVVEGTPVQVDAENKFSHSLKMPAKGPFNAAAVDVAGHRLAQEFPAPAAAPKKAPAPKKDGKKGAGKK